MTNRCFCYFRGEYEFTVLLLLSGTIKYIPPKQQKKTCHVEYKQAKKTIEFWHLKVHVRAYIVNRDMDWKLGKLQSG